MRAICTSCKKTFECGDPEGSSTCYACALTSLTKGRVPELEDFETAAFISREMSQADWLEMQADLRRRFPGDFGADDEDEYDDRYY